MDHRDRAVPIQGDRVVGSRTREHGRVDRRCAAHDRADDRDVPRIEPLRIREHVVDEIDRAVHELHGAIVHDRSELHVQPRVAVDQVVAALPFDQVAAAAAQQNVAGVEREGLAEAVDDQVGQPGDFRRTRSAPEIALPKRGRRPYCGLSHRWGSCGQFRARQIEQLDRRRRVIGPRIPPNVVVQVPPRRAVHHAVLVPEIIEVDRRGRESQQVELDIGGDRPASLGDPVEPEIAEVLVGSFIHQEDVVPALAEVVILPGTAIEDIVAPDLAEPGEQIEDVAVVAKYAAVVSVAGVDPVVAGATEDGLGPLRPIHDDVVPRATEVLNSVVPAEQEVVPVAAQKNVPAKPGPGGQGVVAAAPLEDVVAGASEEDVIAVATEQRVVAFATFDPIVARAAVEGVVTDIPPHPVVTARPIEHDVEAAVLGVGEELRPIGKRQELGPTPEIDGRRPGERRHIEVEIRRLEDVVHGATHVGVAPRQLGERVALELVPQVEAVQTLEVVETVAVLQVFQLLLEDEIEGRTEQAAEDGLPLGETADPEVDGVETAGGRGGEHEGAVRRNQLPRRVALGREGRRARDARVGAVRRDKVDQRFRVLQVEPELEPVRVRRHRGVVGRVEELPARRVQRRDALAAATREVDRRQVERQTDERVPHGVHDELIQFVADLSRQAANEAADRLGGGLDAGACFVERDRVEERVPQPDVVRRPVGIEACDHLGQHRVTEAIDRVGELGLDRRVDISDAAQERIDPGLHLARELLEHEVLVFHFGDEPRRLEQPLTVAPTRAGVHTVPRRDFGRCQEARRVDEPIDVIAEPVVLGVEDGVHRGQGDVLVAAAIAGDQMPVEQLVVIGAGVLGVDPEDADGGVRIGDQTRVGGGVVRDVSEELMPGPERVGGDGDASPGVRRRVAFEEHVAWQHELREPVGPGLEMAVGIGEQQRRVEHVLVDEVDAELGRGLCLDVGPVADVANLLAGDAVGAGRAEPAVEHVTVRKRPQLRGLPGRGHVHHHVLTQEDLMGRMRGVGLVLIHPGCRLVDPVLDVVGGPEDAIGAGLVGRPGQDHEVGLAARDEQRVIRL